MSDMLPALLPYIPAPLLRALQAAPGIPTAPTIDRFPAAVLYADISGFTPLTESLARAGAEGPEELTRLLNTCFGQVIALLAAGGGEVVKFSGDAVTALFPAAGEPPAGAVRRAEAAGRAIQAAVARLRLATSQGPVTLQIKIGIGTGEVQALHVGGFRGRWEYVAAGAALQQALTPMALDPGPLIAGEPAGPAICPLDERAAGLAGILRHYVPEIVLSWLEGGLREWLAVLRTMSVLFIGVRGLDYDQADAVAALHDVVYGVQETLHRYEGTLNKVAVDDKGTVLLALFGAPPHAHEDDPVRALRCAAELAGARFAAPLQLSVGVTTGGVFAGPIGSEIRREYTVLGDTVNLASRLMAHAAAGEILCDYATYRQAHAQVRLESLRPIRLKGKAGLVRVYRHGPAAVLAAPTLFAGAAASCPLVGRRAEVAGLTAALEAVEAGANRILIVEGEAGIGKSRLVVELTRLARERGLAWLLGAGQSIEQQTPYRAWRDVFSYYFELDEGLSPADRRARVAHLVQEVAPDQAARLPLLNDVLALDLPETDLTASLDPALRQQSLFLFLADLLRAWTRERPLVLILEDAHWLDSLSWELTLHAARALEAAGEPFLLVLATRPVDSASPAAAPLAALRPRATTLALDTLSPEETAALVTARLGLPAGALPVPLADLVRQQAGGNPFFAEELVLTLRDQGVIEVQAPVAGAASGEPACRLVGDLARAAQKLPATVQGLVLARIDRLPPERQLAVKMAAVIGRTFSYAALLHLWSRHTEIAAAALQAHLEALAVLDLTPLDSPAPDWVYIFKHIITQEVAYGTLLFSQRRSLHRTVAEWYELGAEGSPSPGGTVPAPQLALLVHHYHYAGDAEKERRYARLAGEQAAAQFANAEAVAYLSRALELTPAEDRGERYALLLARQKVYEVLGRQEAHRQDLESLQALAAEDGAAAGWPAEVALLRSQYAEITGDYAAAIAAAREAIARAAADGGGAAVQRTAAGHLRWGWTLYRQGEYAEAQPHLAHALQLAQEAGLTAIEANCHRSLGTVLLYQSIHDPARAHLEQALQLYRQMGERRQYAVVLNDMGNLAIDRGDYESCRSWYEQSLAIKREIGDRRGEANGLNNLGLVALDQGDYMAAFDYFEQALRIRREVGDRRGAGSALGGLGDVALALGDFEQGRAYLEEGLAIQREIGDRYAEGVSLDLLGVLCGRQGDNAAALGYGQQALRIAQEMGDRSSQAFAWTHIGRAQAGLAQAAAAASYEQALLIRRDLGQRGLEIEVLADLAHWELARGDPEAARARIETVLLFLRPDAPDGVALLAPAEVVQRLAGVDDPCGILLNCYDVLAAGGDPRASALLELAHRLLQGRAARIADEAKRQAFVNNIPSHRGIAAASTRAPGEPIERP